MQRLYRRSDMDARIEAAFARYAQKLWSIRYTVLLLVVMQAFDTLSTILALGVGGGEEGNPVMAETLGAAGGAGMVIAKWAVIALVFVAVALDPMEKPYLKAALGIMNVVYAIVLSLNFTAYGLASDSWALPAAFWALACALGIVAVDEAFFRERRRAPPDP